MAMELEQQKFEKAKYIAEMNRELDPVDFYTDKNKQLQSEKLEGVKDYVKDIAKKRGGRGFTNEDILNIQWKIKEFERWQDDARVTKDILDDAIKKFNPEKHDPASFWVRVHDTITNDNPKPPPDGYLHPIPVDGFNLFANYTPEGDPVKSEEVTEEVDGRKVAARVDYWGKGSEKADKEYRTNIALSKWFAMPGLEKWAQKMVAMLPQSEQNRLQGKATQWNRSLLKTDELGRKPDTSDVGVGAPLMWYLETIPQNIRLTRKTIADKPMPRDKDKEKPQEKDKGAPGLVPAGKGGARKREVKVSKHMVPLTYKSDETYYLENLEKQKQYTVGENAILTRPLPDASGDMYGATARDAGILGESYDVDEVWVEKGIPVYTGTDPVETGKDFKPEGAWIKGRKRAEVKPGEVIPDEVLKSLKNKYGEEWVRNNIVKKSVFRIVCDLGGSGGQARTIEILEPVSSENAAFFGIQDDLQKIGFGITEPLPEPPR